MNSKTKSPTVSIAMTTYNGERFLLDQLESIELQHYKPCELVIVDDGSTDKTLEIISNFMRETKLEVRVITNSIRIGYKANFIKCAALCRGDLIAFCDQDDVWIPEKLKIMVGRIVESSCLVAYHDFTLIDADGMALPSSRAYLHEPTNAWPQVYGLSMVFDRQLLRYNQLWDWSRDHFDARQKMAHDQWFYFLADSFDRVTYVSEALVKYRQHPKNIVGFEKLSSRKAGMRSNLRLFFRKMFGIDTGEYDAKRDNLERHFKSRASSALSRLRCIRAMYKSSPGTAVSRSRHHTYAQEYRFYALRNQLYRSRSTAMRWRMLKKVFPFYFRRAKNGGLRDAILDSFFGIIR